MRIRKGFDIQNLNVTVFPPEAISPIETLEIDLEDNNIEHRDRCQALILAEMAESIGNRRYYEDGTFEKVAIALTAICEQANNTVVNDGIDVKKADNLQRSITQIAAAIAELSEIQQIMIEALEDSLAKEAA